MSSALPQNSHPKPMLAGIGRAIIISLLVSGVAIAARQLGLLERSELAAYDQFVRWQPTAPPNPRLLVVAINENDLAAHGKSDRVISQVINKLQSLKPRVIGLDIYRDLPAEPGHQDLLADLKINQNVIAICGNGANTSVAPPKGVPDRRIGFSDVVLDPDRVLRRNLLALPPDVNSRCTSRVSLGMLLALNYLSQQGITQKLTPDEQIQIGKTLFPRLNSTTGGYHNLDTRGYQILMTYHGTNVAEQVTLQQVLQGTVDPRKVKDRIVLIGVTAESEKDYFYTPFSGGEQGVQMSGVMIHAQTTSQILRAVLERQRQIWVWPMGVDWLWIWGWGAVGTLLMGRLKRPLLGVAIAVLGWASLTGVSFLLFTQAGWVPLVPAALALGGGIAAAIATQANSGKFLQSATSASQTSVQDNSLAEPAAVTAATQASQKPAPSPSLLQGRYQLTERLSHGGFGVTHLAKDTQRPGQPLCVVKQLKMNAADETALHMAREFFQREAQTLEELGHHEQIPRLLAYFDEAAEFYLVQEFQVPC
jgi:CHASE2 domain-containing sensor protein